MKKLVLTLMLCFCAACSFAIDWKGEWISARACHDEPNTWLNYQKMVTVESVPESALARIAADSKYWLWINGELVVFEGSLKRGPNPRDTYYDEVDIAPYLRSGDNLISVQLCYFGRDGFSHKSSGKAGLIFDCRQDGLEVVSDSTWQCEVNPAFLTCCEPVPNYRLSESSVLVDAGKYDLGWYSRQLPSDAAPARVLGSAGDSPWNVLVKRPVPMWRFSGIKDYESVYVSGDSVIGVLPYNAQVTPYIRLKAPEGRRIVIGTDNYFYYNGATENIRTEYITRDGEQEYEALGWMNGHRMYYVVPDGVEVLGVGYRESGYDCDFSGSFHSSDSILNRLWDKAVRTLYVTMRDTYMDCPERERAQWAGDAVNESGESYYALSPSSHALARKWLMEMADWQRADSVIYAPVPAGNWNTELPGQTLATIGYFGAWNYYMHTGDISTMSYVYPAFKRYLMRWKVGPSGLIDLPDGVWLWGDWGDNRDISLLINAWYYLALKGMALTAEELGLDADSKLFAGMMQNIKREFNTSCWDGGAYRSPGYSGETDDRVQALAVVSGIADDSKYSALIDVFKKEFHASPYMEKYVFEAMMQMGYADEALERHKSRFKVMVEDPYFSTLFEHWNVGIDGFDGGSVNHAWTGGGLTVLSQYLCGISPASAGYGRVSFMPCPGSVSEADAEVSSVKGKIRSSFRQYESRIDFEFEAPSDVECIIGIPVYEWLNGISINGTPVWTDGKSKAGVNECEYYGKSRTHLMFRLPGGTYHVSAIK